ncbi:MAG: MBL fold metallo-hydrolase [Pseudomonadota bacterium]|nr:MBL fold metallo-hydrolase [Pseudomonadota bacterium]
MIASSVSAAAAPITSRCLAVAQNLLPFMRVAYTPVALEADEVRLTFVGHSTFLIESPQGIRIATDYAGWHGQGGLPDVVTMNHAHETHYTDFVDPKIGHVLRGWNPQGGHAEHSVTVQDVFIRNVPTNIRRWSGGTEVSGNSIFIFETAGLCIGHLGHLHHELTQQQLAQIGQLDIVMAPVDGAYTLDTGGMLKVLKELHVRLVLPMHYFGPTTLERFLTALGGEFAVKHNDTASVVVSQKTMPDRPQILVLPGY